MRGVPAPPGGDRGQSYEKQARVGGGQVRGARREKTEEKVSINPSCRLSYLNKTAFVIIDHCLKVQIWCSSGEKIEEKVSINPLYVCAGAHT